MTPDALLAAFLKAWREDILSTPIPPMPKLDNYLQEANR